MQVSRRALLRRVVAVGALGLGAATVSGRPVTALAAPMVPPVSPDDQVGPATPVAFEIGRSVLGRPILSFRLGVGPIGLAFVGNIHGGWEPVARDVVLAGLDHFARGPAELPPDVSLYFVPTTNPDGYEAGRPLWPEADGRGGSGDVALARTAFNANGVDLNRNFGAGWETDACGGERTRLPYGAPCRAALGGAEPFSEPETRAYRDFILGRRIRVALIYHEDRSPAILIREGGGGPSEPIARELSRLFDYPYIPRTTAYRVTGHAWDWLDTVGVIGAEIELPYRVLEREPNLEAMRLAIGWAVA